MVKSIFQIAAVSLQKAMGRVEPIPFAFIYLAIFIGFTVFLIKVKPYNCNRFCLYEVFLTLGVVWITLLSLVRDF